MITRYAAALFAAASLTMAHAAPFKVYSPVVESGVTEIEYRGFRDFDRRSEVDHSQTHKLGIGRGFTENWASEVYVEFEKEGDEALKVESYEWENRFQLAPQGKYWADTGLLVEYEHPANSGDPGKLTLAPLIEKELASRLIATLNLNFSHETGSNAASGAEFSYAARLKYNLDPLFEPAIEFFGEPGRIHHFPSTSEQPHWAGPAFYGKMKLGQGQALVYSAALLFATTAAASDKRAVARLEYEF
ncbi:MAG TPA: hypothetical protein VLT92_11990 [Burkholderiales bacterium]|nr:hypothetical protein [Burkholderiales bacterium]